MNGVSLALNWYLNTNLTVMTDLGLRHSLRSAWPTRISASAVPAAVGGTTTGFGTRVQLSF